MGIGAIDKQKIYFPNLNGLRFIAAFLVIIHHIEQLKLVSKVDSYWNVPFIGIIGKLGVILFFVLSGFLITYLLLAEEQRFKEISTGKFYVRRILRIWPLYFLIIILAFLVLPNIGLFTLPGFGKDVIYEHLALKLFLYSVFFSNLALSAGVVPYVSHTWSIGTEEQYYLVWPLILKWFKKHRLPLMFFIVFLYLVFAKALETHYLDFLPYKNIIASFWSMFNIDCMAIGGIFAIVLFQEHRFLKVLLNVHLFYVTLVVTILLLIKGVYIPYVHYEFYAILFGIIILNFAVNKENRISLENRVFNYLGNVSYGLYMYHPIAIALALYLSTWIGTTTNWLVYPLSLAFTIILAAISYRYFEEFFLKFKAKFSNILSGSESK